MRHYCITSWGCPTKHSVFIFSWKWFCSNRKGHNWYCTVACHVGGVTSKATSNWFRWTIYLPWKVECRRDSLILPYETYKSAILKIKMSTTNKWRIMTFDFGSKRYNSGSLTSFAYQPSLYTVIVVGADNWGAGNRVYSQITAQPDPLIWKCHRFYPLIIIEKDTFSSKCCVSLCKNYNM